LTDAAGVTTYPLHVAAPMGFRPSAGWAQGVTDTATLDADLPAGHQLRLDKPAPTSLPIWGSIVDDIWAIEEGPRRDRDTAVEAWMGRVDRAWGELGVEVHRGKLVNAEGDAAFQGTVITARSHYLGVAAQRAVLLLADVVRVLEMAWCPRVLMQRLVGKINYCQSFCVCTRSVLAETYAWIQDCVDANRPGATLTAAVWTELAMCAILLPMTRTALDSPWCERLEVTDAAPGGHGRAWTRVGPDLCSRMAALADTKAPYVSLRSETGVELDAKGRCPLRRLRLPRVRRWTPVGRPGGYRHITLEEAAAATWSLECRLRRPGECGKRILTGGDNAAHIASFLRGRSSSRRLNFWCRRACALTLGGGFVPFWFWTPTTDNPADGPSRVYGMTAAEEYEARGEVRRLQALEDVDLWDDGSIVAQ